PSSTMVVPLGYVRTRPMPARRLRVRSSRPAVSGTDASSCSRSTELILRAFVRVDRAWRLSYRASSAPHGSSALPRPGGVEDVGAADGRLTAAQLDRPDLGRSELQADASVRDVDRGPCLSA